METIEINIEKDMLFKLLLMAQERDITLNQLINQVLKDFIEKVENGTEPA
jgi:hypothetical protein